MQGGFIQRILSKNAFNYLWRSNQTLCFRGNFQCPPHAGARPHCCSPCSVEDVQHRSQTQSQRCCVKVSNSLFISSSFPYVLLQLYSLFIPVHQFSFPWRVLYLSELSAGDLKSPLCWRILQEGIARGWRLQFTTPDDSTLHTQFNGKKSEVHGNLKNSTEGVLWRGLNSL